MTEKQEVNHVDQQIDDNGFSQYLSFHINNEEYGVEILTVQEIIRDPKPSKIPNSSNVVQGMINFRGKVIPLIDIRAKFGLESKESDNFSVAIVLEYDGKNIGLTVDQVSDIVTLNTETIQPLDADSVHELKAHNLRGMGRVDDRLILLLNLEKILDFVDFE